MLWILGSLGSYTVAKTGLLEALLLFTFLRATFRGIAFALSIALSIIQIEYPLLRRRLFNSVSPLSLFLFVEQILTIFRLNEKGIFNLV